MSTCFVIQPFDNAKYDRRFEETYEPAIRAAGLQPYRVDRDFNASIPIAQIEDGIRRAVVCFVEISEDNPNVWFEFGFAISEAKEAVIVCDTNKRERFPFDIQHRRVIRYSTESVGDFGKLQHDITESLKAAATRAANLSALQESFPLEPTEGLSEHEIALLATVASETSGDSGIGSGRLAENMDKIGYTGSRNGFTKLFGEFLFFKTFVNLNKPLVLCEGLTDGIYLKAALRSLANSYPKLVEKVADHYENKISFFRYTERTDKVLRLGGGAGGIKNFVTHYGYTFKRFEFAPKKYPVIVLSDNDDAAKGLFSFVNSNTGQQISQKSTADFYHVIHNLYVIKTPEIGQNGSSCIEDLFDKSVLDIPVAGKKFSANETIDTNKEFGKTVFAEKVIVPNAKKIDFTQFAAVFDRINAVIEHYKAP